MEEIMKTRTTQIAAILFAGLILATVVPVMAKPMPATIAVALTEKPTEIGKITGIVRDIETGKCRLSYKGC